MPADISTSAAAAPTAQKSDNALTQELAAISRATGEKRKKLLGDIRLGGGLFVRVGMRSLSFFARGEEKQADGGTRYPKIMLGQFVAGVDAGRLGVPACTVADARAALRARRALAANGVSVEVERERKEIGEKTLAAAWAGYRADPDIDQRQSTRDYDESLYQHAVRAGLAERRLTDITAASIKALERDVSAKVRAKKNSRGTGVVGVRAGKLVRRLLGWAAGEGWINVLPPAPIRVKRGTASTSKARERVLSVEELKTFWTALEAREAGQGPLAGRSITACRVARFALLSGMRSGEICALAPGDVDLVAGSVTIREAKTAAGVRMVPLSAPARAMISAQLAALPKGARYVFPATHGGAWTNEAAAHFMVQASTLLGFSTPVGLHDLRRTLVTVAGTLRCDRSALKALIGHSRRTGDITDDYDRSEISLDDMKMIVDAVASFIVRSVEGVSNVVELRPAVAARTA